MFIVKNIIRSDVSIPELRITLSPGDQIDLDMISSRFYIDQSRTLKAMFRGNALKCVFKDDGQGTYQIKTEEVYTPHSDLNVKTPSDVIDAVKQLEDKLSKRLDEKLTSQPQVDLNLLNQALTALQGIAAKVGGQAPQVEKSEDAKVEDSRIVNIHERTLDRLSSGTKSNVKHDEQTTDSNVTKNIQELEGLL